MRYCFLSMGQPRMRVSTRKGRKNTHVQADKTMWVQRYNFFLNCASFWGEKMLFWGDFYEADIKCRHKRRKI